MKQSPSSGYRVEKNFTEELKQLNADQQSVVVERLLNKHPLFKSVIGSQTDHAANEVMKSDRSQSENKHRQAAGFDQYVGDEAAGKPADRFVAQ